MQAVNPPPNLPTLTTREWTTNWAVMPSLAEPVDLAKL